MTQLPVYSEVLICTMADVLDTLSPVFLSKKLMPVNDPYISLFFDTAYVQEALLILIYHYFLGVYFEERKTLRF